MGIKVIISLILVSVCINHSVALLVPHITYNHPHIEHSHEHFEGPEIEAISANKIVIYTHKHGPNDQEHSHQKSIPHPLSADGVHYAFANSQILLRVDPSPELLRTFSIGLAPEAPFLDKSLRPPIA
jgi:hypothetical protein